jgi:hypothetical protein
LVDDFFKIVASGPAFFVSAWLTGSLVPSPGPGCQRLDRLTGRQQRSKPPTRLGPAAARFVP